MHQARQARRAPSSRWAWGAVVGAGALAAAVSALWPRDVHVAPQNIEPLAPQTGAAAAPAAAPMPERVDEPAPLVELQRSPRIQVGRAPQGVRGRLVDARGEPLSAVPVQLNEAPGNDPAMLLLASQARHLLTPVASCETAADGTFELGLRIAEDKEYDVFALSPQQTGLFLSLKTIALLEPSAAT